MILIFSNIESNIAIFSRLISWKEYRKALLNGSNEINFGSISIIRKEHMDRWKEAYITAHNNNNTRENKK